MKRKVWNITVKDNPNRVVMGENDEFYTTDTEAYLVFNLDDKNFNPATAVLTLENRNDGSLKNETVDVVDGLIEWEMPQRYIEHFGNWQGQLVYEDTKDGQPELYTSATFSFVVNAHIGDKKKPSLVEIENWEKFIRDGTELIGGWKEYILELKQRVESGEFDGVDGTVRFEELTAAQIESLRGETGRSMEFDWNGTQLGVRIEGQTDYHYIELKGEKGETGEGLEYDWSGTQLGVRKEKDTEFSYVDLKGDKGDTGEIENLDSSHIVGALGYVPISETDVPEPTWANLQNKPTEFNPTSHTHGWEEVTNKPSTFTPSTHTHSINDVTGLRAELDSVPELTKENVGLGNVDNVKQASKVEHDQLVTDFNEHQTEVTAQLAQIGDKGIQVGDGRSYGYFSITKERTALDYHGFEDLGQLNITDDVNLGYSSFDAKPTLNSDNDQNHLVGYQARPIFNGSGNLTNYLHGYDVAMTHSGSGTVERAAGMYINDISGNGPIEKNYGIYIKPITKGDTNYAIYSEWGDNYFGGDVIAQTVLGNSRVFGIDFGEDSLNKRITIGYGLKGDEYSGRVDIMDGKRNLAIQATDSEVGIYKKLTLNNLAVLRSYKRDVLPSAAEGAIAFCTDGLKQGETSGSGTGVLVYYSAGSWRRASDDSSVSK